MPTWREAAPNPRAASSSWRDEHDAGDGSACLRAAARCRNSTPRGSRSWPSGDSTSSGGDDAASSTLRQALGLWRGEAFVGFSEVEACVAEARRLEELRLALLEDRVDADLAAGQATELVGEIETLCATSRSVSVLGSAHHRPVPLGASARCPRGLPAGPPAAGRRAGHRARARPAPSRGSRPRAGPSLDVLARAGCNPAGFRRARGHGSRILGPRDRIGWLREAWADAVDGRGGFVSVLGPEGIGKTRLVAELALEVHDDGAAVLYGRCDHAHRGARALLGQACRAPARPRTRRRRRG